MIPAAGVIVGVPGDASAPTPGAARPCRATPGAPARPSRASSSSSSAAAAATPPCPGSPRLAGDGVELAQALGGGRGLAEAQDRWVDEGLLEALLAEQRAGPGQAGGNVLQGGCRRQRLVPEAGRAEEQVGQGAGAGPTAAQDRGLREGVRGWGRGG